MASLFEINSNIDSLLESDIQRNEELVDGETGEILSLEEMLDQLELDQKTKIENVALYIKNINADIEAMKNEEKKMAERRKVRENQAERLKTYLSMNLQNAGYQKFETARCVLSFRKSTSVEIKDGAILPKEFIVTKVTEAPDKKALLEAMKLGEMVDGCNLVEKLNLQIK